VIASRASPEHRAVAVRAGHGRRRGPQAAALVTRRGAPPAVGRAATVAYRGCRAEPSCRRWRGTRRSQRSRRAHRSPGTDLRTRMQVFALVGLSNSSRSLQRCCAPPRGSTPYRNRSRRQQPSRCPSTSWIWAACHDSPTGRKHIRRSCSRTVLTRRVAQGSPAFGWASASPDRSPSTSS